MSNKNKAIKGNNKKNQKQNSNKSIGIAIGIIAAIAVVVIAVFAFNASDITSNSPADNAAANETTANEATSQTNEETTSDDAESLKQSEEETEVPSVGNYIADIDIEGYGTITVELDGSAAPITVQNFVDLAESGFYDGLTFHRIMEGFMMQGGDPLGNGTGGSEKNIKGEFSANGVNNPLSHTRGAISMARSQMNDSASSQFFICHDDATFLDGQYACFGYVTDGMDVVDKVCTDSQPIDDNGTIPSEAQPVIKSITIRQ